MRKIITKNNSEYKPQPINAVYIVNEISPSARAYVVKVLKNMVYARPEVKTGKRGYDKEIKGTLKRPHNGRVQMMYDYYEDHVRIWKMIYFTKFGKQEEETDVEYKNFIFRSTEPEYNFFNIIENNWKQEVEKKKAEKIAERKKKKFERIAALALNNS